MRGYSAVGVISPKTEQNIGGVLRAAHAYDASLIILQGARYKRLSTDTSAAYRHIPLLSTDNIEDLVPYDCTCVGVEFLPEARDITNYVHPERALYIFGGEDITLSKETLSICRDVIKIPTKICLNLAAAVNVVLYDRLKKKGK